MKFFGQNVPGLNDRNVQKNVEEHGQQENNSVYQFV